jgi:hypoxanthine phosphoribosyltransferase
MALLERVPANVSAVIGVVRSGMIPASVLASMLHVPLLALDHEREQITEPGHGWRLRERRELDGPALVVDDTTGSGRALEKTRKILAESQFTNAIVASIYVNPESRLLPDVSVRSSPSTRMPRSE